MNYFILNKRSYLGLMAWSLLAILAVLFAVPAFAQANPSDLLAPYRDFIPPEDLATRVMEGLLGSTYTSPLTSGLSVNTLFGSIFLVFNVIVFAVGTVWASYGVISGIVQTAHEGVVLGKRMSAVWMPVRMVTGIGGLVPVFGGFSLSQVAMIIATSWGISFANFAYNEAVQQASRFTTLINPSFVRTDSSKDGPAMARALFEQHIIELEYQRKVRDYAASGLTIPAGDVVQQFPFTASASDPADGVYGKTVGTVGNKTKGYAVGIKRKSAVNAGTRSTSVFGFRSNAVDYASISNQAWNGYRSNFPELIQRTNALADAYYRQKMDEKNTGVQAVKPLADIRATGVWYASAAISAMGAGQNNSAIKTEALNNMTRYGFFSAGSFYSTHAEANAAILQAANVTDFVIVEPSGKSTEVSSGEYDTVTTTPEESVGNISSVNACVDGSLGNDCSLGQKMVTMIIGANTTAGSSFLIDPIIALKNIGDYMMVLGESILGLAWAANAVTSNPAGAAVTGVISAVVPGAGLLKSLLGAGVYVGGLLFAVGALCSLYIPMVPFITWVSALVQYCCIVVESIAAAPLWALAHLQADGEGMGQRTEKGYLYLLNLLFRPILMVAGFFAASALVILLGSVVTQMYIPTIASTQGNSITGLFSIIGFVFLFFVIMNILIQGLFHVVMELADDAIGWVGGIGRNSIGKDTEGKVSNMFMMGGRFGSGMVDKGMANMGKGKAAPAATKPGTGSITR
jgi:conjugal transfer/type IV secretion protein DotA/TraY